MSVTSCLSPLSCSIVQNIQGILDELFIHGGQHTAAVNAAAGRGTCLGQVLHPDGLAAALRTAAQQVITADAVIVRHLHHKGQSALPDAFFVMGKLGLADPQVLRRLFLCNAPFFAQQRKNAAELHGHIHPLPWQVPPVPWHRSAGTASVGISTCCILYLSKNIL